MHINLFSKIADTFKHAISNVNVRDENKIDELLQNPSDKIEFEKAVDELIKGGEISKEISLNNKKIEISL